jgi:membrane-anchored protein YejM (alkaline phosphatase superfamily)
VTHAYYLALTFAALLVNAAFVLRKAHLEHPVIAAFTVAVIVSYSFLYTALVGLVLRVGGLVRHRSSIATAVLAVLAGGLLQILLFADRTVYEMYGFHANGFVLNLVTTQGGIESMGLSRSTSAAIALVCAGLIALQGGLYLAASRLAATRPAERARRDARRLAVAAAAITALFLAQSVGFAYAQYARLAPIVSSARLVPFYLPLSMRRVFASLGMERPPRSRAQFRVRDESLALAYPRAPLRRSASAPSYNIVWLVSESLRADALDPVVMPALDRFASRSARFVSHVSGSNGTRWGMFSLFYGLYGSDWFHFLDEVRGPVLFDELIARGYDLEMFTSARFTYPEFESTVFAAVPNDRLHEKNADRTEGWKRDRENVEELLASLERRDRNRPFMRFMFFESPHANYYFPPESVVKKPYLEDFNYLTTDPDSARVLLKNRYLNACHHLDSQLERIFQYLEREGLLESTIVVVTGDHGEEFMDSGRWGHNSQFSDAQIRVPLVIRMPQRAPETVQRLTSHLDVAPTVLAALGIENDPSDFSLGHDLFGSFERSFVVVSDWNQIAYIDEQLSATFTFSGFGKRATVVRDRAFTLAPDARADQLLDERQPQLLEMLSGLRSFHRTGGAPVHASEPRS